MDRAGDADRLGLRSRDQACQGRRHKAIWDVRKVPSALAFGFLPQQAWKFEEGRYRLGACRVLPPEPPFGPGKSYLHASTHREVASPDVEGADLCAAARSNLISRPIRLRERGNLQAGRCPANN